ncbi:unnamed protein product [Cuscuta epithymum]|uniref:Fe2OG dioxygenase domain-containing protein n=1 Tax=Cuscuta epithymum TaxID=186058 RepID=A0AAV0F9Z8_9ASTE|nr:unnamed protein product [Cuscuta epithymum]
MTEFTMAGQHRTFMDEPFLLKFCSDELRIASEFFSYWLPFLSRDLCHSCTQTLVDRIRLIDPEAIPDEDHLKDSDTFAVSTPENTHVRGYNRDQHNCDLHSVGRWEEVVDSNGITDTNSLGSWKEDAGLNDTADTNSLGSWKDGLNGSLELTSDVSMNASLSGKLIDAVPQTSAEGSISDTLSSPASVRSQKEKMSWADMAQEDELEAEDKTKSIGSIGLLGNENTSAVEGTTEKVSMPKVKLSRERREQIRFHNVKRKKDFICLEKVNGKIVNILGGLELHTGVFSAVEQIRIVDYVEALREKGKNGHLKERTYTAPQKWMKGKGRITIQFGCCYNYAIDKNGNPPGILRDGSVDPIPELFKVMIRRLVKWHVMPPNCIPDSCIVNIYEEGDCIPPHIDNHDFVRPFCTVSFLSECNIVFGSNLNVEGPGQFAGSIAIPLPVGSVLVINGKAADVAKHCVPSVPMKRISITFRRMDESKRPVGYAPEPDLLGIQPLPYEEDQPKEDSKHSVKKQGVRQEVSSVPRSSGRSRQRPMKR